MGAGDVTTVPATIEAETAPAQVPAKPASVVITVVGEEIIRDQVVGRSAATVELVDGATLVMKTFVDRYVDAALEVGQREANPGAAALNSLLAGLAEAFKQLPAPVVNVAPAAAPAVTVNVPPEQPRDSSIAFKRDPRSGEILSATVKDAPA
jgi:hypothetical protein